MHTGHLWDSRVFRLFACGMQRIHKHKKVGCALTESLAQMGAKKGAGGGDPMNLGDEKERNQGGGGGLIRLNGLCRRKTDKQGSKNAI